MIVADTNLVAYMPLAGENTADAERVRAKDADWISPPLLRVELSNVLAQSLCLKKITRDEGVRLFRRGLAYTKLTDHRFDPVAFFNLIQQSDCTPYDLEFVQLAIEGGVPLITADRKFIDSFPDIAVGLTEFGRR